MPYAIDASVLAVKQPFLDASAHRIVAQAGLGELPERDDAVLAAGDPGNLMLR